MARRKGRGLNPQEKALWDRVAHTTTPLERRENRPRMPPKPEKAPDETKENLRLHVRLPDGFAIGANAPSATKVSGQPADPLRMDKKQFRRMTQGKLSPDARIDLHGLTLAQAHPALTRFILSSQAAGRRLVLVITGKGRGQDVGGPVPVRPGALRREVPIWLRTPPLSQAVLQVTEASRRHGGSGAYYVYLGRLR